MRSLIEGLPDYERMMARSLSLWSEAIGEILRELETARGDKEFGCAEARLLAIHSAIGDLRALLPADPGPLKPPALFQALERELDHLHKRIVHAIPDRAYAHERCRIIEQLLADLKAHALR